MIYRPLPLLLLFTIVVSLFFSCASIPDGGKPVGDFKVKEYLGTWYEIGRIDNRFERNLNNVTATYSLKRNNDIEVINKGYDSVKKEWRSATGTAKFRKQTNIAALKVSFFKPFYAGYNVVSIDKEYKYALVAGKNLDYLWLLSRDRTMPAEFRNAYLKKAGEIGYDTTRVIWVRHDN